MARDKNIVTKRDGVGAYGLYVDFIIHTSTGEFARQERRFLIKNLLCTYSRRRDDKRAAWRTYHFPTHEDAREALISNLEKKGGNVEFINTLVVEMTESDMESVAKKEAPYGRFAAVITTERAVGKIDDATWRAKGY